MLYHFFCITGLFSTISSLGSGFSEPGPYLTELLQLLFTEQLFFCRVTKWHPSTKQLNAYCIGGIIVCCIALCLVFRYANIGLLNGV